MPSRNPDRPKPKKPFNVKELENWKIPGTYGEGNGLYFQVRESKNGFLIKSWIFRYRRRGTGKLVDMGIGSFLNYSLKEAREIARDYRKLMDRFKDPLREREKQKAESEELAKTTFPFETVVDLYWRRHKAKWKSEKHADSWLNQMKIHAFPILGKKEIATIQTADVLKVLDPIWGRETGRKLRGALENVFDFAKGRKYFRGDNPAALEGNLESELPAVERKQENQPSLDYQQLGSFMEIVRSMPNASYRALEFTILTACRSNEVYGAKWEEVDLDAALWTIPAERMKKDKEHYVPLSPRALEILKELEKTKAGPFIFPGDKADHPLSDAAMLEAVKEMHHKRKREDEIGWVDPKGKRITVHGFRATFKTWSGNCTTFDRETVEFALAHKLLNQVEAAYQRGTHLPKRQLLMEAWDAFCARPYLKEPNVIPIRAAQ